jgi:hypothetical protein
MCSVMCDGHSASHNCLYTLHCNDGKNVLIKLLTVCLIYTSFLSSYIMCINVVTILYFL